MDGVFGLPRRKKAGISYRDSLHGHLFFADQMQVDHFVNDTYTSLKNIHVEVKTVCHNFSSIYNII